jgi:GT2 family glycosyltransferase
MEIVVIDDKSPRGDAIKGLANECQSVYVRNTSRKRERQPAFCRNLGFKASAGDIVVFNDADVIPEPGAVELYARYHELANVVVDAQVWGVAGGQSVVENMKQFTAEELMRISRPFIQVTHPEHIGSIVWSTVENVNPSENWWSFLSAQCCFKRDDLLKIGGWDEEYLGWGAEDNDVSYRAFRGGLRIVYAQDIKCFHIDHATSFERNREKCVSALRNLNLMCRKYPELANDRRVRARKQELETMIRSDVSLNSAQGNTEARINHSSRPL